MAQARLRLPANAEGSFFVDSSCIDCDACRRIAPDTFQREAGQSAVFRQPGPGAPLLAAQQALLSCPTASIGDLARRDLAGAIQSLPALIADDVYQCGFNAESSFGAFSYLIRAATGNILVDSPRFTEPLAKRLEELGGVQLLVLTHRDDVADHRKFHERFGCDRLLHREDVTGSTAGVERQPQGVEAVEVAQDLVMIPVPGHTRGHVVFLYRDRFLFSGDHLAWSASQQRLTAFRDACWYSWKEQTLSMERLARRHFEWVLPGHGRAIRLERETMQAAMLECVERMQATR